MAGRNDLPAAVFDQHNPIIDTDDAHSAEHTDLADAGAAVINPGSRSP